MSLHGPPRAGPASLVRGAGKGREGRRGRQVWARMPLLEQTGACVWCPLEAEEPGCRAPFGSGDGGGAWTPRTAVDDAPAGHDMIPDADLASYTTTKNTVVFLSTLI